MGQGQEPSYRRWDDPETVEDTTPAARPRANRFVRPPRFSKPLIGLVAALVALGVFGAALRSGFDPSTLWERSATPAALMLTPAQLSGPFVLQERGQDTAPETGRAKSTWVRYADTAYARASVTLLVARYETVPAADAAIEQVRTTFAWPDLPPGRALVARTQSTDGTADVRYVFAAQAGRYIVITFAEGVPTFPVAVPQAVFEQQLEQVIAGTR